jgi:hypothetical protein
MAAGIARARARAMPAAPLLTRTKIPEVTNTEPTASGYRNIFGRKREFELPGRMSRNFLGPT